MAGKHGDGAVCFRARDAAAGMLACQHPPSLIMSIAVCLIAGLTEGFDASCSTPPAHDIAWHIAECQVLRLGMPDWAFGENIKQVSSGE